MAEDLLVELSPPIAALRLNRPNALSMDLMRNLIAVLRDISSNKEIKVVTVAGEGPVFSAGHDLNEMVGQNINDYREIFDVCTDLMTSIQKMKRYLRRLPHIGKLGAAIFMALRSQLRLDLGWHMLAARRQAVATV